MQQSMLCWALCPRVWRDTLNLRQILQYVISDGDGEDACRTLVIRHLLRISSRPRSRSYDRCEN